MSPKSALLASVRLRRMMNAKKFASQSAFFDLRVLAALFIVSAGAAVALFATAIPSELAVPDGASGGRPDTNTNPGKRPLRSV